MPHSHRRSWNGRDAHGSDLITHFACRGISAGLGTDGSRATAPLHPTRTTKNMESRTAPPPTMHPKKIYAVRDTPHSGEDATCTTRRSVYSQTRVSATGRDRKRTTCYCYFLRSLSFSLCTARGGEIKNQTRPPADAFIVSNRDGCTRGRERAAAGRCGPWRGATGRTRCNGGAKTDRCGMLDCPAGPNRNSPPLPTLDSCRDNALYLPTASFGNWSTSHSRRCS